MKNFMICCCLAAGAILCGGELAVPFTAVNPVIDGSLADPVWRDVRWHELTRVTDGGVPEARTRFKLIYGMDDFFLAVECDDPDTGGLIAERSDLGSVWEDDSLEIFFANGDGPTEQLVLNSAGKRANIRNGNAERGADDNRLWHWQVATGVGPGSWRAEIRVPYTELTLNDRFLDALHFNLGRNRWHPVPELSMAGTTPTSGFHRQDDYLTLRLQPGAGAESIPGRFAEQQREALRNNAAARLRELDDKAKRGDAFACDFHAAFAEDFARLARLQATGGTASDAGREEAELVARLVGEAEQFDRWRAEEILDRIFQEEATAQ